jgi:Predicted phosphoesterases, related to the Icc protein
MKILAISDIHERIVKINKLKSVLKEAGFTPELVVVAGDLTYFKSIDFALKILRKIREVINSKVIFIPGNCDPLELAGIRGVSNDIVNIHARTMAIGSYVFYGVGGSGITPFNTLIEYSEEEFREILSNIKNINMSEKLIIVTHQPIRGYFDEVNGIHVGSLVFAEYLNVFKPILWITGHVHEQSGFTRSNGTTIVHPGPLMKGYYALIELENSTVKNVKVDKLPEK